MTQCFFSHHYRLVRALDILDIGEAGGRAAAEQTAERFHRQRL